MFIKSSILKINLVSLCLLFSGVLANVSLAEAKAYTLVGKDAETVRAAFEWTVWNPQGGKGDGKHVYVLAAPRCGRCESILKGSRQIAQHVEIRWVFAFHQIPGSGFLHEEAMPDCYEQVIKGKRQPDSELQKAIFSYNNIAIYPEKLIYDMTPVVVFSTAKGLRVVETANVKEVLAEIQKVVPIKSSQQQALPLIKQVVAHKPDKQEEYYNLTDEAQNMHLLPSVDSPVISALPPERGFDKTYEYTNEHGVWRRAQYSKDPELWQTFILVR